MPTRNHTRRCGRNIVRVTTCEGAVTLAVERDGNPKKTVLADMHITNDEAQVLRDLLDEALVVDPFTRMAADQ